MLCQHIPHFYSCTVYPFCLVARSDVLDLFRTVFYVLTSAMQDEPANKTFFMDEVMLTVTERHKARFPLGDFFRAKRLFPLSASLIISANAMPTKEKVASREKSRLVQNGLKRKKCS